jgi:predicted metalloprotease
MAPPSLRFMGEAARRRKHAHARNSRPVAALRLRNDPRSIVMAERERETIVTTDGGGGGGGTILAVVLLIAVIVVLFLLFGRGLIGGGGADKIDADIKVDTPAPNGG